MANTDTTWTEAQIDRHLHLWEHRHGPDSPEAGIVRQLRAERDKARDALPDMVKPLEWDCTDWSAGDGVKGENDCEWTAEVWPMTSYIISWFGGERFEVNTPLDEKLDAKSLAAAKDAAQSHYAAAILSAFGVQGGEA